MPVTRLIATDEAGYGPTLGPLVITASVWELAASPSLLEKQFTPFADGFDLPPLGRIRLADSKELYTPRSKAGLSLLAAGIAAVLNGGKLVIHDDCDLIRAIASEDWPTLCRQRWYGETLDTHRQKLLDEECAARLATAAADWQKPKSPRLHDLKARVVEPNDFNSGCERAGNKASLLTELALELIGKIIRDGEAGSYQIWCDKHGGRNRYAAVLLNEFPEAALTILDETRQESRYRMQLDATEIDIRFRAKADSFPPVAFSSMVAKYVRERLMARFNHFWNQLDAELRPTAGYASDAARFLNDIRNLIEPAGIQHHQLVRCR